MATLTASSSPLKSFLKHAEHSSQSAYKGFKTLLKQIENPKTHIQGLAFLHELTQYLLKSSKPQAMIRKYHFSFSELTIQQEGGAVTHLRLLQLPSTFEPEEWSFTFFEGLARYPTPEFYEKTIVELGCGIGWITLALAQQAKPKKIYGLDINPRAIVCSKLNLYLNAFDALGKPSWSHEGRNLTEIVEFHTSDLLAYCSKEAIFADRIIGCIPQVLNPDPQFDARMIAKSLESENDEFLHSLSNYTMNQGFVEDQFGLGLIAKTLEEAVSVLKSSGKIILNLGGRPGAKILHHLFLRRGFTAKRIWQTQVEQAQDTDIQALVEIEKLSSHRFEFFVGRGSDTPVSAKTAQAYSQAGGKIAHALSVYESQMRDPSHLPQIIQTFRDPGLEKTRAALDLSYLEDALCVEKTSFLCGLIDYLKRSDSFPYEQTKGIPEFRARLALFFQRYFKIPFEEHHFLTAPSRVSAVDSVLDLFKPQRILMDSVLASKSRHQASVVEIPDNADLLCEFLEKLHPQVAFYVMPSNEAETKETYLKITETAFRTSTLLFIDISDLLELSSSPKNTALFRHLSLFSLPPHIVLLGGLVKNRLYQDLEVAFLISFNKSILKNIENTVELTYSRTPVLSQLYYNQILKDLLNFQILDTHLRFPKDEHQTSFKSKAKEKVFGKISKSAQKAFTHPSIADEDRARGAALIRLDYGENSLPASSLLKQIIFEAFSKKQLTQNEINCIPEILRLCHERFGIDPSPRMNEPLHVVLGGGVAPLFSEIVRHCAQSGGTLLFPGGSYGNFIAAARFHGTRLKVIPTFLGQQFKLTARALEEALSTCEKGKGWLVLSAPIVNPTGAIYSPQELEELIEIAQRKNAVVIFDTIFAGLEYQGELSQTYFSLSQFPKLRWILLGGMSKEFAAGGLRVGYWVSSDPEIQEMASQSKILQPHATLMFVLKQVLDARLTRNPTLLGDLDQQRKTLQLRATQLTEVLEQKGWKCLPPSGGLFLIATPENRGNQYPRDQMGEVLFQKAKVVVNTPAWTGIPGYYRFVLSTCERDFQTALARLHKLKPLF